MIATTENIAGSKTAYGSSSRSGGVDPSPRIRVWLTDDNAHFRGLLEQLLVRARDFDCERQFHSAESLLEVLASETAPDVILLDVEMGGMTGVEALRPIRALAPNVRVLIVTSFFDPMYEAQAVRDGASAYVIKAHTPQILVEKIHIALASPVASLSAVIPPGAIRQRHATTVGVPEKSGPKRNLAARLGALATHLSTNLFRPAPVSAASSHT